MKRFFLLVLINCCAVALWAAPATKVPVSHPQTTAAVNHPVTSVQVSRPTTVVPVSRPNTSVTVNRPVTTVSVQHPVTPGSDTEAALSGSLRSFGSSSAGSSGGSYTPTYKQAKTFETPKAAAPKLTAAPEAAQLVAGQGGLGMKDPNAAQKAADAASMEKPKAESSQLSVDEVLKKTNLPPDLVSKLKQRNFESSKSAGKK